MLLNLVFPFKRLLFMANFFVKRMYFNNIYGGKGYDDIREQAGTELGQAQLKL